MKFYTIKMVIIVLLFYSTFPLQAVESKYSFIDDIWKLEQQSYVDCSVLNLKDVSSRMLILLQKDELEKRGCCSHHGGVCGCSGDRAKCCDGALSPSCGC